MSISAVYELLVGSLISATEQGYVPDFILRRGIRYLLSLRASAAAVRAEEDLGLWCLCSGGLLAHWAIA
jgi:hypothetical protein